MEAEGGNLPHAADDDDAADRHRPGDLQRPSSQAALRAGHQPDCFSHSVNTPKVACGAAGAAMLRLANH